MGNSVKARIKDTETANQRTEEVKEESNELKTVKAKLIKAYGSGGINQLRDLAEKLIDKEKTKQEFFSHLLRQTESARRAIGEEHETFPEGFPNKGTRTDGVQRMAEHIRTLEVKLILHELNDTALVQNIASFVHNFVSSFTFGPFHASLLIGDVLLEWRPNSLVIPRRIKAVHEKDNRAVLFANLHETSFDSQLPSIPLQYEGVDQETVASSFEMIKDITYEKEHLIDALVEVVVRYNLKMTYGVFTNNCQHFVRDVLIVLGITDPEKAFRGRIKDHAALVIARHKRKDAINEFNSHQELDQHIKETKAEKMSQEDLEFAYCHYLLFHAWGQKCPFEEAWACDPDKCQANAIAKLLH